MVLQRAGDQRPARQVDAVRGPASAPSLVARWSRRIPAGETSAALLQINDLLPTWIEAAGGAVPPEIEGA